MPNVWKITRRRVRALVNTPVVEKFHRLYYADADRTWKNTFWGGVRVAKCPLDLWVYQEIVWSLRPDVIIETGTAHGGSALYFASLLDVIGHGRVISIDIAPNPARPRHARIEYLTGSSIAPAVVGQIRSMIHGQNPVMVVLDADHRKAHVREELRAYHPFVTPGSYLIVEDTNVNGHPVLPEHGEGPMEAVREFVGENSDFEVDRSREKFWLTFNPGGYLRRKTR